MSSSATFFIFFCIYSRFFFVLFLHRKKSDCRVRQIYILYLRHVLRDRVFYREINYKCYLSPIPPTLWFWFIYFFAILILVKRCEPNDNVYSNWECSTLASNKTEKNASTNTMPCSILSSQQENNGKSFLLFYTKAMYLMYWNRNIGWYHSNSNSESKLQQTSLYRTVCIYS